MIRQEKVQSEVTLIPTDQKKKFFTFSDFDDFPLNKRSYKNKPQHDMSARTCSEIII